MTEITLNFIKEAMIAAAKDHAKYLDGKETLREEVGACIVEQPDDFEVPVTLGLLRRIHAEIPPYPARYDK